MKFSINAADLVKTLNIVAGIIEARNTIPMLSHILVTAIDGRIEITGTDLDRYCVAETAAEVEEMGAEVIPAGIFKDIVSRLPKAATVTLTTGNEGRVSLQAGRGRFALSTLNAADFPSMKPVGGSPFTISAKAFRAIFEATIGSVSTEETRFYLNGVYLHNCRGALRATSTDGHRMAWRSMDLPAGAENIPGMIVPTKSVHTLMTILEAAEGDVTVWATDARLWVHAKDIRFSSGLVQGQFPDYERAVPRFNGAAATFNGQEFAAAVERAAAALPDAKAVPAGLLPTPDGLVIKTGERNADTAVEHVETEFHEEAPETTVNSKYLVAMTKVFGTAPISMHITNPSSAVAFTSKAIPEQLYVIMPLRR